MASSVKEMILVVIEASEVEIEVAGEVTTIISVVAEVVEAAVGLMIEAVVEEVTGVVTTDIRETDSVMTSEAPVEVEEDGAEVAMTGKGWTRGIAWSRVRTLGTT